MRKLAFIVLTLCVVMLTGCQTMLSAKVPVVKPNGDVVMFEVNYDRQMMEQKINKCVLKFDPNTGEFTFTLEGQNSDMDNLVRAFEIGTGVVVAGAATTGG